MTNGTLYIGTKRYSSWSLRGWLPVRLAGLAVEEVTIPLAGGVTAAIRAATKGGTVPYLRHQGAEMGESLAIAEYCAEFLPALWPADRVARAHARAIAGEMHAGYRELRMAMPMSLFRPGAAGTCATEGALGDIARIDAIWQDTRARFGAGGPYLFGAAFNNADVMFAPVVCRLLTYQPKLSPVAAEYCAAVRAHPLMVEWYDGAAAEPRDWYLATMETAP